jgi:hypothetical protein
VPLGLSAEFISAIQEDHARFFFALEAEFGSGTLRINSTPYQLTINGVPFTANTGGLGRVSSVERDARLQIRSVTLELAGVPNQYLALAANDKYRYRRATLYMGLLSSTYQVIPSPTIVFQGIMDSMSSETEANSTVSLVISNRIVNWERSRIRRYTDEDQQSEFPGDRGFEYVPSMIEKKIDWGMS